MLALYDELLIILDEQKLTPHFQPIVSLSQKKIIGYEALIRGPVDSSLHYPSSLFNTADYFDLGTRLEFICREVTIKSYAALAINEKLFLNVSPSVLLQPEFKQGETLRLLDQFGVDPRLVIIELTENQPTYDYPLMREAATHYRSMGFEIALDDLGAGYSGLRLWSELLPEYVKIDRHFIQGLNDDTVKLNFVRCIQLIADSLNCKVIAEGIETQEECRTVEKLGVAYAQGYYFAEPAVIPVQAIEQTLFAVSYADNCSFYPAQASTATHILKFISPVSSETTINEVMHLFQHNNELTILPLVDNALATGIIIRDRFFSKLFSSRYGLELYGKKPIKTFIATIPVCIDENTPLELVSKHLTSTMRNDPAFVITRNGEYAGIGTLLDLLEEITRRQIHNAQHANPLTLLPGSVPTNEYINQLLADKIPFSFGYFDLDNFKPFNDVYGYSAGDDILKAVAHLLSHNVTQEKGRIGHIGGDDFIVIFTCPDWLDCCKAILAAFKNIVPTYYKAKDIAAGGIQTENRMGEQCFFPLISLSIGIVDPLSTGQCQSHVDIADLASEAKKMAKKQAGNSFFINKRRPVKNSPGLNSLLPCSGTGPVME